MAGARPAGSAGRIAGLARKGNLQVICRFSSRRLAALAFMVAAIPFGIAGHLVAEAVALDHESFWSIAVAPRHIYLLALGIAALLHPVLDRPRPALSASVKARAGTHSRPALRRVKACGLPR